MNDSPPPPLPRPFWLRAGLPIFLLLAGYLALMAWATGTLRNDEVLVAGIVVGCLLINDRTREFAVRTLPLTFYGMAYDLTHLTEPLVHKLHVHVSEAYHADRFLFGLSTPTGPITLNEYFAVHHWPWLDLLTGTAYILFLYWALAFGFYLVLTGRTGARHRLATGFTWAFFAMNVAGFITYYVYPTAPPWYVADYGLGPVNFAAVASPAAAIRWDQLTGIHYFEGFYAKSADIFGALPSLHAAQPALVFLYGLCLGRRWLNVIQGTFYLLVCFSAIYLQHHYVVDVLAGSAYALTAFGIERGFTAWRLSKERTPTASPTFTGGFLNAVQPLVAEPPTPEAL